MRVTRIQFAGPPGHAKSPHTERAPLLTRVIDANRDGRSFTCCLVMLSWMPFSPAPAPLPRPVRRAAGRSEFYLMVGDSIVVPFQAVAGDVWQVQRAGADLEWAGQYRVGPILPFQPVPGWRDAQQVARDLRVQMR